MKEFTVAIGAALLLAIVLPLIVLLNIGGGIIAGLIVGVVLDDTWTKLMNTTGWALEAWQTGGLLAFVGSFFKVSASAKSE